MGKPPQVSDKQLLLQVNFENAMGLAKQCTTCCRKFGLFLRESRCYKCKRSTCNDCLIEKQKIVYAKNQKFFENDKKKICSHCEKETKHYADNYLSMTSGFGVNSPSAFQWLKTLKILGDKDSNSNPEEGVTLETLENRYWQQKEKQLVVYTDVKYKDFILQKVNCSFLSHFYYATKTVSFEEIQISLCRIVNKLAQHYNWIKAPIKVDIIIMFLLTFSSEPTTYAIFMYLYDNVFPRYIIESMHFNQQQQRKGELWQIQMDYLQKTICLNQELTEKEKAYLRSLLEKFALDMLSSLFVNILNFDASFNAIDLLIKTQKFRSIENILCLIVLDHVKFTKDLSQSNHIFAYRFFQRTFEFKDIADRTINYPPEQRTLSKSLPAVFVQSIQEDGEKDQENNQQAQQDDKHLTTQFQENYSSMMMSPQFNLLIGNDNNEDDSVIGYHEDDDDDEEQTPQSSRNKQSQLKESTSTAPTNFQSTQQTQQQYDEQQKIPTIHNLQTLESEDSRCQHCINKDQTIQELQSQLESEETVKRSKKYDNQSSDNQQQQQQLVAERDSLVNENRRLQGELTQKDQIIELSKATHESEVLHLKNEIQELSQNNTQNPYKKLLEQYKELLNEAKSAYEELYKEKQEVELQLINEKEEILVQSIRDKSLFMNEIKELEEKNTLLLTASKKDESTVQSKIQEQQTIMEQLNQQVLTLNSEKKMLQEELRINHEKHEKIEQIINEITTYNKEKSEKESDSLTTIRALLDTQSKQITQHSQEHKQDIETVTERDNLVFSELRTQIDEYEHKINEINQTVIDLNQKMLLESQLHETKVMTLQQEHEVERNQMKSEFEKAKAELVQDHSSTIEKLQKEIEALRQQIQTVKQELTAAFETEKKQINEQHETVVKQKEEQIHSLEEKIKQLATAHEAEKKQIIQQCEEEKQVIHKQKEEAITELNDKIKHIQEQHEGDKKQLKQTFEQEKIQINEVHAQELKGKDKIIEELNERINKLLEEIKDININHEKEISDKVTEITTHLTVIEQKQTTIITLQKEIEGLKSKIAELEQKFIDNNNEMSSLQIALIEKEDDFSKVNRKLKTAEERVVVLEEELEKMKKQYASHSENLQLIKTLQEKIIILEKENTQTKASLQEKEQQHANCDEIIKKLKQDQEKTKNKLQQKVQEISVFQNIFKSVKQTVETVDKKSADDEEDD